jgi:hypothetical protein
MDEANGADIEPDDGALALIPESLTLPDAPVGGDAKAVRGWFDAACAAIEPVMDGSLAAERDAARSNETSKFPT